MRVLVLGVNGQDGGYLAQSLVDRGHVTLGIGRNSASRWMPEGALFEYRKVDLTTRGALDDCLVDFAPDAVFHFAAIHGAAADGFTYEAHWHDMILVNVLSLHTILEYARTANQSMRIFYAGSSKVFPAPLSGPIDEGTPMRATCLYSVGKLTSRDLMEHYRTQHGIVTTNLILFNHDSPRRAPQYFLPTIARALREARSGSNRRTTIATLDFHIDWTAADEMMDLLADLVERPNVAELVVASGNTYNARAFVRSLFQLYGLKMEDHLIEKSPPSNPGPAFQVDIGRLASLCGRRPGKTAFDIVEDINAAGSEQDSWNG